MGMARLCLAHAVPCVLSAPQIPPKFLFWSHNMRKETARSFFRYAWGLSMATRFGLACAVVDLSCAPCCSAFTYISSLPGSDRHHVRFHARALSLRAYASAKLANVSSACTLYHRRLRQHHVAMVCARRGSFCPYGIIFCSGTLASNFARAARLLVPRVAPSPLPESQPAEPTRRHA